MSVNRKAALVGLAAVRWAAGPGGGRSGRPAPCPGGRRSPARPRRAAARDRRRRGTHGQDAGWPWPLPFRIGVARHLRPGRNLPELEVCNLPANRVAALARQGAPRVRSHDIDFVDIRYRPFDPAGWAPVPSGIAGPAQLRLVGLR